MSNTSDFRIQNGKLTKYVGPGGDVVIPDGVTTIGEDAFKECTGLTSVTLPDSVTTVGSYAFYGCTELTAITLPDGVTTIGKAAFRDCTGLTSVTIPDGVTTIGNFAFECCTELKMVTLSDSVTTIGDWAFRGCIRLTAITLPDSVTTIGDSAFRECKRLTSVTLPDSVTTIGDSAFRGCTGLTAITLPDSVTTIGDYAFWLCTSLKKITLPVCLGSFATKILEHHDQLRIDISDLSALPAKYRIYAALCFAEDGGDAADPRYESHMKYLKANAGKMVETAVQNLPLLTLLCRERCIKAKDVEAYVDAVQKTGDVEKIALLLDYQNNTVTAKQKQQAAKQKEKQEDTVFDRAVARMGQEGIAGLNIAATGELKTFENRNELKAFIESKGGKLQSSISAKTDYLIMNAPDSDSEKKKKAESLGIEVITEAQFNDKTDRIFEIKNDVLIKYRNFGRASLTVPDGVTAIGDKVFRGCTDLTSVTIPNSVTTIGDSAFKGCTRLTAITIPDSVTEIGDWAFEGCTGLTAITIPDSVTAVDMCAFEDCKGLTSVTIPGSVTTIGWHAFKGCTGLTSVTIPDSVTTIGEDAFDNTAWYENQPDGLFYAGNVAYKYKGNCPATIVIKEGTLGIAWSAFKGCTGLTAITLPDSVTTIGDWAFRDCNLTIHGKPGSYAEQYAKEKNIPFVAE